jgi:hypothetical protein
VHPKDSVRAVLGRSGRDYVMMSNIDRHYLSQRDALNDYEKSVVELALVDLRHTCELLQVPYGEDCAKSLEASIIKFVMNSREGV